VHYGRVNSVKFRLWRNVVTKGDLWGLFSTEEIALDETLPISGLRELNRSTYSSIREYDKEAHLALKVIRPQTNPRDSIRKYFHSQAKREFRASLRLQSIGIATPKVFGYAYSISPISRYESILFMEYKEGMANGFGFLANTHDRRLRKDFLKNVAGDINTMYKNCLHHRDCNFGNILVGEDMHLLWIDNDLKIIRNDKESKKYLRDSVERLKKSYKRGLLTDNEWEYFANLIDHSAILL
jgi:RIO-like serine/threonine protein kinase